MELSASYQSGKYGSIYWPVDQHDKDTRWLVFSNPDQLPRTPSNARQRSPGFGRDDANSAPLNTNLRAPQIGHNVQPKGDAHSMDTNIPSSSNVVDMTSPLEQNKTTNQHNVGQGCNPFYLGMCHEDK